MSHLAHGYVLAQPPQPALPRKSSRLASLIARVCVSSAGLSVAAAGVQAQEIEEILVVDEMREGYRVDQSSLTKFTEPLRDIPQGVTMISRELMEDRGSLSLNDALRNVPGITLGAGEFSWQGNNPSIRGFSARNDMFLDGMRDFGNYYRDPFNLETVEVLQGPSSMVFGRGSTGGVINQSSKTPLADPLRRLHINVGSAATRRVTADFNQPLDGLRGDVVDDVAFRLNLMQHEAEVADRDGASTEHWGVAPSLSMSLGSATRLTLSYLRQHSDHVPDYGLPWINERPAAVPRETFYGFESDYIESDVELSSLRLDHEINADWRANAQLRYADYARSHRITEPQVRVPVTPGSDLATVPVDRLVFQGESQERMFQVQFNLLGEFSLGGIRHALVTGVEAGRENSSPLFGFPLDVPGTTLLNPAEQAYSASSVAWRLDSDTRGDSLAFFAMDTMKLNEQWQIVGGLRWDQFDSNYRAWRYDDAGNPAGSEQIVRKDIETSWRAALVYKPVEEGTVYIGSGTSFNPSSEGLSFVNSGRNLTTGDAFLDPETNRSIEAGTKWELFGGRLFAEASIFRITKRNARVPDPDNPGFNILAGEQEVDGVSINLNGRLFERLEVAGGYTWLDSKQKESTNAAVPPNAPLQNVAENTFSLWLNYLAGADWEFGVGARYVDERLATNARPFKQVPDYWAYDAMAKYQATDNLAFKLNLTNFTDEHYYDQLHPWHVVPGAGFTGVFAINLDF